MSRSLSEGFQTVVDATSGEVLVRQNCTKHFTPATYRVYTGDSPRPGTPGWPAPITFEFPVVERELVTLAALSQTASPEGWIPDTGNQTLGNNVDASVNGQRPQGTNRVFDFSLNLTNEPTAYAYAAAVNLFYWCNWMHDKLYDLGFTETAGNFQHTNFEPGGVAGDRVLAFAQATNGANNANFTTYPDGNSPIFVIWPWTGPTPDRDGDLDTHIILHEYAHGLSDRLVGGGITITAAQPAGLSEGWSDFYALALLSQLTDNVNGNYPFGGYVSYQWYGFTHNYYYGVRRYPYTHDMTKNPLTFKDIDPDQADNCDSGAPYSSLWTAAYGPCIANPAADAHNVGEVWCVTLWEARRNLISKYGQPVGNQLMLQLVTDGMSLCPQNPTFIQARDAILLADLALDPCADNWGELWTAFVKRGMGRFASAPTNTTTSGVVESFAEPIYGDPCQD